MRKTYIKERIFSFLLAGALAVTTITGTSVLDNWGIKTVAAATQVREWSANSVAYALGDLVVYNGAVYECTYAHSSNEAWTPTAAFTLWKARPDITDYTTGGSGGSGGSGEQESSSQPSGGGAIGEITNGEIGNRTLLIGYYHTWDNSGNPFIKLRDVDSNWDVINISFAEPVSPGSGDGRMQLNIGGLTSSYTKADFNGEFVVQRGKKNFRKVVAE